MPENVMTKAREKPLNPAEIVRWQFGRKYGGSEVRHSEGAASCRGEVAHTLAQTAQGSKSA